MENPIKEELYQDFEGLTVPPLHTWYVQKVPIKEPDISFHNIIDFMRNGRAKKGDVLNLFNVATWVSGNYGLISSLSLPIKIFLRKDMGEMLMQKDRRNVAGVIIIIFILLSFLIIGFRELPIGILTFYIAYIVMGRRKAKAAKQLTQSGIHPLFTGYSVFYDGQNATTTIYTYWKQKEVQRILLVSLVVLVCLDITLGLYLLLASMAYLMQVHKNYEFNRYYLLNLNRIRMEQESMKNNQGNNYEEYSHSGRGGSATI